MTVIEFHPPGPLLNLNGRLHWAARSRDVKAWRTAAKVGALVDLGAPSARAHPPCTVTIELPVKDNRRRDPHNYVATLKAVIDGLVDAGVWPDDTPDYVTTTEPVLTVGARKVRVTLTPREPVAA